MGREPRVGVYGESHGVEIIRRTSKDRLIGGESCIYCSNYTTAFLEPCVLAEGLFVPVHSLKFTVHELMRNSVGLASSDWVY